MKKMWIEIRRAGSLFILVILASCHDGLEKEKLQNKMNIQRDPHSYSKPEEAVIKHIDLDLEVNFEQKELSGTAEIKFKKTVGTDKIILDTKDIMISSVLSSKGEELVFSLQAPDPILGSALEIQTPANVNEIIIRYRTGKEAEALQWLEPEQTADKNLPFLFTQSQAILARSWIPLQDSPAVRKLMSMVFMAFLCLNLFPVT